MAQSDVILFVSKIEMQYDFVLISEYVCLSQLMNTNTFLKLIWKLSILGFLRKLIWGKVGNSVNWV